MKNSITEQVWDLMKKGMTDRAEISYKLDLDDMQVYQASQRLCKRGSITEPLSGAGLFFTKPEKQKKPKQSPWANATSVFHLGANA